MTLGRQLENQVAEITGRGSIGPAIPVGRGPVDHRLEKMGSVRWKEQLTRSSICVPCSQLQRKVKRAMAWTRRRSFALSEESLSFPLRTWSNPEHSRPSNLFSFVLKFSNRQQPIHAIRLQTSPRCASTPSNRCDHFISPFTHPQRSYHCI